MIIKSAMRHFKQHLSEASDCPKRHVAHPTLISESGEADPDGPHAFIPITERPQALRTQVFLGLHFDRKNLAVALDEKINLALGVLGGPVERVKAAIRHKLLADVI